MATLRSKIEQSKRGRLVPPRPEEKGKVVVTFLPTTGGRLKKGRPEKPGQ